MAHLGGIIGTDTVTATVAKIDNAAVNGLMGTPDSLAYIADETEHHVHSPQKIYGATSGSVPTMVRRSLVPITVTAGDTVWGTELIIYNGSGISENSFDMNQMRVSAVGTANRLAIYEFLYFAPGTPKAATTNATNDKVTDATNTVANNDKIYFPTLTGTGVVVYEVYFVINRAAGNFEVSRTRGGAKVDITGGDDVACTYVSLGASDPTDHVGALQFLATETIISRASGTPDPMPTPIQMDRILSSYLVSCRGLSAAGGNTVGFHVGLHVYPA